MSLSFVTTQNLSSSPADVPAPGVTIRRASALESISDPKARPLPQIQRLLIVRLSAMGDVIHALPAAYALRQAFPDLIFNSIIPYSVRAKDSVAAAQSILTYDPKSALAKAYRGLAEELTQAHV